MNIADKFYECMNESSGHAARCAIHHLIESFSENTEEEDLEKCLTLKIYTFSDGSKCAARFFSSGYTILRFDEKNICYMIE